MQTSRQYKRNLNYLTSELATSSYSSNVVESPSGSYRLSQKEHDQLMDGYK